MTDRPTITAIIASPKEPELRRIRAGRTTLATIRHSDVDRLQLCVGDEIDADMLDTLTQLDRRASLRLRAIRSLSRAHATRHQLAGRLGRTDAPPEDIDAVLDDLTQEGMLDDRHAATQLIEEALRRSPTGEAALLERLMRRGIDDHTARQAVHEAMSSRDPAHDALQAGTDIMRTLGHTTPDIAARRLAGRLARRGFSPEIVESTVSKLTGIEQGSHGTLGIDGDF